MAEMICVRCGRFEGVYRVTFTRSGYPVLHVPAERPGNPEPLFDRRWEGKDGTPQR